MKKIKYKIIDGSSNQIIILDGSSSNDRDDTYLPNGLYCGHYDKSRRNNISSK